MSEVPVEFSVAHIPGATNLPLLTDEHRVIIGTVYKHSGQEAAIRKGWDLSGPRFGELYRNARKLFSEDRLLLHCWRGGMRSEIMAWLSAFGGGEVLILQGGYKMYRKYVLELLDKPPGKLHVVGGKTGSGKTEWIKQRETEGEQVIDLEALACHKGSSFGSLGQAAQPVQEQFENNLAEVFMKLNTGNTVWVEYESRTIGRIVLPAALYFAMLEAPMTELVRRDTSRIARLVHEYAAFPLAELESATLRIAKRLGGLRTSQALEALHRKDFHLWIQHCLAYYDKTYAYGLAAHKGVKQQLLLE
jgi:tRNA 2-selenouridine synthase